MQRINTATKAVNLFGAGKHGFTDGVPGTTTLSTRFSAAWANSVQEEISYAVEAAGLALNESDNTQLTQAIGLLGGPNALFNPITANVASTFGWALRQNLVNLDWFTGVNKTASADNTAIVVLAQAMGNGIKLGTGTYSMNWIPTTKIRVFGNGSNATFIRAWDTSKAAITYRAAAPYWTYASTVEDLCFEGLARVGVGFTFGRTNPADYTAGDEYFNNVRFRGVLFLSLDKGVQFPFGNIGSEFYSCGWTGNKYGVYALNSKHGGDVMHAGNKKFFAGQFDNNDCGVYVHNTADGFGGFDFDGTIFEHNKIHGYFYSNNTNANALVFAQVWQEAGGSQLGGTVTLDQWAGTVKTTSVFNARNWIFDGSDSTYVFRGGGIFGDVDLRASNSVVHAYDVKTEALAANNGGPCSVASATSEIVLYNPSSTRLPTNGPRVFVEGYFKPQQISAAVDAGTRWAQVRHRHTKVASLGGVHATQRFTGAVTTVGAIAITGTLVNEGHLYTQANQFSVGAGTGGAFGTFPSTSVTPQAAGAWVVATIAIKSVSGPLPTIWVGDLSANQSAAGMTVPEAGVWYTLACIAQTLSTGAQSIQFGGNAGAHVFQAREGQLKSFATRAEAQAWLASGAYAES